MNESKEQIAVVDAEAGPGELPDAEKVREE